MSKNLGFNYHSNKITKHSDGYFREREEVFDYVNNEYTCRERFAERKNKHTGSDWSVGLGFFPKPKPTLAEGNSCTTLTKRDDSTVIGIAYGSRDLTPKEGGSESDEGEEKDVCPVDPNRPGLKYKRRRRRRTEYKEGDHVSQSQFGIGFKW